MQMGAATPDLHKGGKERHASLELQDCLKPVSTDRGASALHGTPGEVAQPAAAPDVAGIRTIPTQGGALSAEN